MMLRLCVLLCLFVTGVASVCPVGCVCRVRSQPAAALSAGVRVVCRSSKPLKKIGQVDLDSLPADTVSLDLSGNRIASVGNASFEGIALQRLDLSRNNISQIEANAFHGLTELLRLNLTANRMTNFTADMFNGLHKLERLSLSHNPIKTLAPGTFDLLPALKKIDFQSELLVCDCHLRWIVQWIRSSKVKVSMMTVCVTPRQLESTMVRSLKANELHCDWPAKLPHFEVTPSSAQVVFEGDRLPLVCTASLLEPNTRVRWLHSGQAVQTNESAATTVSSTLGHGIVTAQVLLRRLSVSQSGAWRCEARTSLGVAHLSVTLSVVPASARTCQRSVTTGSRGEFRWPRTLGGLTATLSCDGGWVTRRCDASGQWERVDAHDCHFSSESTRVLQLYAKLELSNLTMLVNHVSKLRTYIPNAAAITDKMDVIFTARIVENLSKLVAVHEKLSDIILYLVSVMMGVDKNLLREAQAEERSCSRLISAVESLPSQLLDEGSEVRRHTHAISFLARSVNMGDFAGLTCVSYDSRDSGLVCSNSTGEITRTSPLLSASLRLPSDLLTRLRCLYPVCSPEKSLTLQIVTFSNARLFPQTGGSTVTEAVNSTVISARIVGLTVENISNPLVIRLRSRPPGIDHHAVIWDSDANDGLGRWLSTGCSLVKQAGDLSTIHCPLLTSVAVMQMVPPAPSALMIWMHEFFNLSAAIYVGTSVLVPCLLIVIISMIVCRSSLKMPVKTRHAVINTCITVLLLCITYTFGVRIHRPPLACPLVGITLHHLVLAMFAWIAVCNYTIYKRFSKAACPPPPPTPEELANGPRPPKPLLGFYLLGYGVAMLVVGITTAISLQNYDTDDTVCFLASDPQLYALYLPSGLLVAISCIFLLRMCCLSRLLARSTSSAHDVRRCATNCDDGAIGGARPSTVNGSVVGEADLYSVQRNVSVIEEAQPCMSSVDPLSDRDLVPVRDPRSELDPVYSVRAQICIAVTTLVLCTLTCACAVLAQAWHSATGWAYAGGAVTLGCTLVAVHCFGRADVRSAWRRRFAPKPHRAGADSANLSLISSGCTTLAPAPATSVIGTETSSSMQLAGGGDQYRSFYNARQNGVARKYWQRSRQQGRRSTARLNNDTTAQCTAREKDDQRQRLTEFMQRNGSMPRLRDFDGQSHASSRPSCDPGGPRTNPSDDKPGHRADSGFLSQLQQRIPPQQQEVKCRSPTLGVRHTGGDSRDDNGGQKDVGQHLLAPVTSSSDSDSDEGGDIWVPQAKKQETSV